MNLFNKSNQSPPDLSQHTLPRSETSASSLHHTPEPSFVARYSPERASQPSSSDSSRSANNAEHIRRIKDYQRKLLEQRTIQQSQQSEAAKRWFQTRTDVDEQTNARDNVTAAWPGSGFRRRRIGPRHLPEPTVMPRHEPEASLYYMSRLGSRFEDWSSFKRMDDPARGAGPSPRNSGSSAPENDSRSARPPTGTGAPAHPSEFQISYGYQENLSDSGGAESWPSCLLSGARDAENKFGFPVGVDSRFTETEEKKKREDNGAGVKLNNSETAEYFQNPSRIDTDFPSLLGELPLDAVENDGPQPLSTVRDGRFNEFFVRELSTILELDEQSTRKPPESAVFSTNRNRLSSSPVRQDTEVRQFCVSKLR